MSEHNSRRAAAVAAPSGKKRRRKRSLLSRIFRWALLLLLLAVLAAGGTGAWYVMKNPPLRQVVQVALSGGLDPAKSFPGKDSVNILLLGKDEDRDNRGQIMRTRGRTDTILLAQVDFSGKRVSLLSIPRDTLAEIPLSRPAQNQCRKRYGGPSPRQLPSRLTGVRGQQMINYRYSRR